MYSVSLIIVYKILAWSFAKYTQIQLPWDLCVCLSHHRRLLAHHPETPVPSVSVSWLSWSVAVICPYLKVRMFAQENKPIFLIYLFLWYWGLNPGAFYLRTISPARFYFLFGNRVSLDWWESHYLLRPSSDLPSSCLSLPSTGITGMHHHAGLPSPFVVCWCTPVIPVLGRLRQEDCRCKDSLSK